METIRLSLKTSQLARRTACTRLIAPSFWRKADYERAGLRVGMRRIGIEIRLYSKLLAHPVVLAGIDFREVLWCQADLLHQLPKAVVGTEFIVPRLNH